MKFLVLSIFIAVFCFSHAENVNSQQEEKFPGQKGLSVLMRATGGFKGKIFLNDVPNPKSSHAESMLYLLAQSVPKKNILTYNGVAGTLQGIEVRGNQGMEGFQINMGEHTVRVIHAPTAWFRVWERTVRRKVVRVLKEQDILGVYPAGNVRKWPVDSDRYHPDSPYWDNPATGTSPWEEFEQFFRSGHAVMAAYAVKKPQTLNEFTVYWADDETTEEDLKDMYENADEYVHHPMNSRFGTLKEYGFSVLARTEETIIEGVLYIYIPKGTSSASAELAAFAFYLYQLWDTTAEVVRVMQETAIDIGEPGIDEDFGWGLINAHHPTIWNRAIKRLEKSLEVCLFEDMTLEQAMTVSGKGLDMIHRIEDGKREIGLAYSRNSTKVAITAGSGMRPFGLSSQLLQEQSTTVQAGILHSFADTFFITGIYGRSRHEDFAVNKGSIGAGYRRFFSDSRGNISLYVGHRTVWGSVGIPGYRAFDIAQTPFALRMVEARASLAWIF